MSTNLKRRLEKLIETAGLTAEDLAEVTQRADEFVKRLAVMAAQAESIAPSPVEQVEAQARLDAIVADVQREIAGRKVRA